MRRLRPIAGYRLASATRAALAAYVLLRLVNLHLTATLGGSDSIRHLAIARRSLWDAGFWSGRHPWGTPLLWKLLPGGDVGAVMGQLAVSTVAWAALAVMTSRSFRSHRMRLASLVAVLAFSLVWQITAWDGLLLSESLSLSLFALAIAAWMALLRAPSWRTVGLVLAAMTWWTFTRDTNAYLGLMILPVIAVWIARSTRPALPATVFVTICALFALSAVLAGAGKRNLDPVDDLIHNRLINDTTASAYFYAHGMPAVTTRSYRAWLEHDGERTYLRYVLSHPDYAFVEPLVHIGRWVSPDFRSDTTIRRVVLPRPLGDALYPEGWRLYMWLGVAALVVAVTAARFGAELPWLVGAVTALLAVPHGMVVWLGSEAGLDRHALLAAVQLRLGLLLLVLFAVGRAVDPPAGAPR
jgi:hypothetical protein